MRFVWTGAQSPFRILRSRLWREVSLYVHCGMEHARDHDHVRPFIAVADQVICDRARMMRHGPRSGRAQVESAATVLAASRNSCM